MATETPRKFYFAASIRGGREDVELHRRLIDHLKTFGKVLTEDIGSENLKESEEGIDDKSIHDQDIAWLGESDALIAEVTTPSLGVGYEIGRALERGKKILCLFRPDSGKVLSAMIRGGADGEQLVVKDYQDDVEAKKLIKDFLTANGLL